MDGKASIVRRPFAMESITAPEEGFAFNRTCTVKNKTNHATNWLIYTGAAAIINTPAVVVKNAKRTDGVLPANLALVASTENAIQRQVRYFKV